MIKYISVIIFLFMQQFSFSQDKPTLIYVGDPMCSWCYGFAPELSETVDQLKDKVEVRMIMGGLRPYNTEQINSMKDFLKEHWEHVNQASGQKFEYGILDDREFVYDTEPPSRAVLVVRELNPEVEFDFFQDVQEMFYLANKHTNKIENYYPILDKYKIDREDFARKFDSNELKELTKADFGLAAKMGVRGFPSMVLLHNGEYQLISNGYAKCDELVKRVEKVLQK